MPKKKKFRVHYFQFINDLANNIRYRELVVADAGLSFSRAKEVRKEMRGTGLFGIITIDTPFTPKPKKKKKKAK